MISKKLTRNNCLPSLDSVSLKKSESTSVVGSLDNTESTVKQRILQRKEQHKERQQAVRDLSPIVPKPLQSYDETKFSTQSFPFEESHGIDFVTTSQFNNSRGVVGIDLLAVLQSQSARNIPSRKQPKMKSIV